MRRESRGISDIVMYDMLVLWIDVSNFILPRLVIFSIFSISFPLKSNIIFDGVFALKIFALAMLVLIPIGADVPVILIIFPAFGRVRKDQNHPQSFGHLTLSMVSTYFISFIVFADFFSKYKNVHEKVFTSKNIMYFLIFITRIIKIY